MAKPEPRTAIVMLRLSPTELSMLDELVQSTGDERPKVLRALLRREHAKLVKPAKPAKPKAKR